MNKAVDAEDIDYKIAFTSMAEIYLAQARFAAEHPEVVMGVQVAETPPPTPVGPPGGPKLWGPAR